MSSSVIEIRTTLVPFGPATAIELNDAQVSALGGGKRAPVVVTIGARSARLRLSVMGGQNLIGISKANRSALGVDLGDTVDATVELDTATREIAVPEDLAAALSDEPGAREAFDQLSFTRRKELVQAIVSAKRPETRARRILLALDQVRPTQS